ncbi:hypothetical protein VTN96DRAFT_8450 [Rasamsonia emersonii]
MSGKDGPTSNSLPLRYLVHIYELVSHDGTVCLPVYIYFISRLVKTMVTLKEVRESNSALRAREPGQVILVTGATSGIGETTLLQMAIHMNAPTVYLVGRNEGAGRRILEKVTQANPQATFHFIQADVSSLSAVDAVCDEIKRKEKKLDILFLSAGVLHFGARRGILPSFH